MVSRILSVVEKNFRQIFGSKSLSLIIIVAPLIIIILAGLIFSSTSLKEVKIGTFTDDSQELVNKISEGIRDRGFEAIDYPSLESCKSDVKEENTHLCLHVVVEDSGLREINEDLGHATYFYADYSKVRLVWPVINVAKGIIDNLNLKITEQTVNMLAENIDYFTDELEDKEEVIEDAENKLEDVEDLVDNSLKQVEKIRQEIHNQKNLLYSSNIVALGNEIDMIKSIVGSAGLSGGTESQLLDNLATVDNGIAKLQGDKISLIQKSDSVDGIIYSSTSALNDVQDKVNRLRIEMGRVRTQLPKLQKLGMIKRIKGKDIVDPIPTHIHSVTGNQEEASLENAMSYLDYLTPSIIIMTILFVSALLGTVATIKEKKSPAALRNYLTPTRGITFTIGTYLSSIILVMVQVLVLFLIAFFGFASYMMNNLLLVLPIIFILASIFIFLGISIGYLFKSEETAIIGSVSLCIIFLIASELILPIETLPKMVSMFTSFNPFVLGETILRKLIIFELPIMSVIKETAILGGYAIIAFFLALFGQKRLKKDL
jgi:ABC-type polysaccharide/polyol phosphate export permease